MQPKGGSLLRLFLQVLEERAVQPFESPILLIVKIKKAVLVDGLFILTGEYRIRTGDPLHAMQILYQLS